MDEEEILDSLHLGKWKGKYTVSWCHSCDTATIICPVCKNQSCNCSGCDSCMADHEDWKKVKKHISDYLSPEENAAYQKGLRLQCFIKESIRDNDNQIDWKRFRKQGNFSQYDEQMFKEFLIDAPPYAPLWRTNQESPAKAADQPA